MANIKVIVGSTRPNRFGGKPGKWILELAKAHSKHNFELVDLEKIGLPLLDEPMPPSMGNYQNEHTKEWAKIVDEADGFILVTAEYNHSVPAALKNAMDYIGKEGYYKPVGFVSYGAAAGGARAVEHFRSSISRLNMFSILEQVIIVNYWSHMDQEGNYVPSEQHISQGKALVEKMEFWSEYFKDARKQLAV